jgi:3-oxoadipate enol-lactonase
VLVHGYPLSQKMWEPQMKALSNQAHVIAVDLRGHGESEAVSGNASMEQFADDIAELIKALKIDQKIVICGLSMGGYVAFAFVRKYAALTAALVLAATRAGNDSAEGKAGRDQAAETARTKGIEAVGEGMLPKMLTRENFENNPMLTAKVRSIMYSISLEGMVGDLMALKGRPDSRPMLESITIPTLILHGADDQLIPPQEAKDMHSGIRGSRLELIPNAGHLLNLEQPAAFNAAMGSFLSELKAER